MNIRRASYNDLHRLWGENFDKRYNAEIDKNILEVWLIEENGKFIGRLDILWNSDDKDYANGKDKAYLSAFHIAPDYQGRGLGTRLMKRVIGRICEKGYTKATIGAAVGNERIYAMYKHWGFTKKIKEKEFDYCENGKQISQRLVLLENSNIMLLT